MELLGKNNNVGERSDTVDYKVAMKIHKYTHKFIHIHVSETSTHTKTYLGGRTELSGKNNNVGERSDIVDYKVAMKIHKYTHKFIHIHASETSTHIHISETSTHKHIPGWTNGAQWKNQTCWREE